MYRLPFEPKRCAPWPLLKALVGSMIRLAELMPAGMYLILRASKAASFVECSVCIVLRVSCHFPRLALPVSPHDSSTVRGLSVAACCVELVRARRGKIGRAHV